MIYHGREISTEEAILLHSGACISQYVLIASIATELEKELNHPNSLKIGKSLKNEPRGAG